MWQYNELYHHGIQGQKWGVRRYQNPDGTLTEAGKIRYGREALKNEDAETRAARKKVTKQLQKELPGYLKAKRLSYKSALKELKSASTRMPKKLLRMMAGNYATREMVEKYGFLQMKMLEEQDKYNRAVIEGAYLYGIIGAAIASNRANARREYNLAELKAQMEQYHIDPVTGEATIYVDASKKQ